MHKDTRNAFAAVARAEYPGPDPAEARGGAARLGIADRHDAAGRGDDVSKGHTNDEATAPHGRVMRWGGRSCLYRRPAQLDVHNESKPRCTASCKFRLDFSRKC